MLKSYKTERQRFFRLHNRNRHRTIGVCLSITFIWQTKEIYEKEERFVSVFLQVAKSIFRKILKFHGLRKSTAKQLSKAL